MEKRILVIDDEATICSTLELGLSDMGFTVKTANCIKDGINIFHKFQPHVVLSDMRLNNESGLTVIDEVKKIDSDVEVIIMTAYSDISNAVESIKKGAFDYVNKPFELDEIKILLNRAYDNYKLKNKLRIFEKQSIDSSDNMVYECERMQDVMDKIDILAENDNVTVLILGATGTGKEMVADAIHSKSVRKDFPIVRINCSTIPAQLVESELFGYEKNAFTGADNRKKGLFELANGGTVFLDELGELPLEIQAKLLRFLEEKKLRRVGGLDDISVDVRIIAATNRDLEQAVKEKTFREDLYYRLNVIPIVMPSLQERDEDIILLAEFFIDKYNKSFQKNIIGFDEEAKEKLREYSWPGNIRELKNVIERAVLLNMGDLISVHDLPEEIQIGANSNSEFREKSSKDIDFNLNEEISLVDEIESIEKEYIEKAIKKSNGNQTKAADILGISRFTLKRKIEKYEIE